MSAPNLTVVVEPSIGGAVIYGPLAAATGFGDMAAQLSIRLWITNNESSAVVVNTIALSFVPPPLVNPVAISVNFTVGPAETTLWNFSTADNVILPEPPPPTFTVSVWCNTFTDPKTITLSLDPHSNMVTGGAYLFPAKADDLRDGEFWQGTSAKHSAAGAASSCSDTTWGSSPTRATVGVPCFRTAIPQKIRITASGASRSTRWQTG
jgi:hypothetical protein